MRETSRGVDKKLHDNNNSDLSIYEAMVNLAQDFSTRYPLIDMHGNVGSLDGDPAAAMRYCVTEDNLITTSLGLIKIADIVKDSNINNEYDMSIKVQSIDKVNDAIKFFNSGVHPIKRVVLKNGFNLAGSYNHPILTLREDGKTMWKTLDTINETDLVVLSKKENSLSSLTDAITEEECIDLVASIDKDSTDQEVFESVLRSSKNIQGIFLREFFSRFAEVLLGDVKRHKNSISLNFGSKVMLEQIQVMLLHFGIVAGVINYSNYSKLTIGYSINLKLFKSSIGFSDIEKVSRLDKAVSKAAKFYGAKNKVSEYLERNDLFTVQVKAIEDEEPQVVYSIKVDSYCHSFVSNGIISHNTESRLTALADETMRDIEKNTVDMANNFDGTMLEPIALPTLLPLTLMNGE